ncbi:methyltransferase [Scytonema hofmannii PCC 7110]|uniref:Methyltransferase n=1 Tax=Scytonema hofmannii PCC 7110 TaxID=128403 RepID=A0A139X352_9CYAN|nr:class I SAM-dependent methyltransferase [Scytonema hofmannii]KYC39083.1 methyltransferase [Scytonema hofmannii PCC 7110]
MSSSGEKDYPSLSDLSEADLGENLSVKKMLRLVGENKQVVDFGCATGYFARWLTHRGCQVTGVEINSNAAQVAKSYCEQVIVADLDFTSLVEILPNQTFDVAVFGDVLEHLRDPWRVLQQARQILKPEGYVVVSIPNIAHGAIRLALLQGRFEYMAQGILDNTHLRFFTYRTVKELLESSGYFIDVMERTKLPISSASELLPDINTNNFDIKILQSLEQDEEADTLQFVIRAFPLSLEGKYAALNEEYTRLVNEVKSSYAELEQIRSELQQSQSELQEKETELEKSQIQIQQKQSELERSQVEIKEKQKSLEQSQTQLQHIQTELERVDFQLQQTQAELKDAHSQIKQTQVELKDSQSELQQTQAELENSQWQLQQLQAELEHFQSSELQQTQAELQYSQLQLQQVQLQLQQAHAGWERCQNIVQAMESSKFWKIRQNWFMLKSLLGLKND